MDVLTTTQSGTIDACERASVALYDLHDVMDQRDTARVAVQDGAGHVHLDVYPASGSVEGGTRGTVVFVGGLSAHALSYAGFQAALARRGWNVVAVDLRGHGRSSGKRGDFTTQMIIEDLQTAAEYAQARFTGPLALFGSSLGGYFSLVGAGNVEQFSCAVSHWIYSPGAPVTKKDERMTPVALFLARVWPSFGMPTKAIAKWDHVTDDPKLREAMFADPLMTWKYTVRSLVDMLRYSPDTPITQLRIPHLVVLGERDEMTPAEYTRARFAELEGDKEWAEIPDAGHMGGLVEHREDVLDVVCDFLERKIAVA